MNKKKEKILIYPSQFNSIDKETHYGIFLAKKTDRPAELVDIENVPISSTPKMVVEPTIQTSYPRSIQEVKEDANKRMKNLKKLTELIWDEVEYDVEIGFPEPKLLDKIEEENPFMLVIGQHRDLNLINEWLGTFETRMAKKAECPVLVVPESFNWSPPLQLLYITESFTDEKEQVMWLIRFAESFNSHLTVAEITEEEQTAIAFFNNFKARLNSSLNDKHVHYFIMRPENVNESIQDLVKVKSIDWLSFKSQDNSFPEKLLQSDNTERRILASDISVLIF